MRTTVLGLTVVLANGDILKTGSIEKIAGYNLIKLRMVRRNARKTIYILDYTHPESIMSAVCQFPDLDSAVLTAQEIIQYESQLQERIIK